MITNDVLRSLRYMLDLSDGHVIDLVRLSHPGTTLERATVAAFLRKEGEPGFEPCDDATLAHLLEGLVFHRRGRDESAPARPVEARISNNLVLKKLRVAFELKDADMHAIFEAAGHPVTKPELSALFRQRDHRNFRPCGDQLLRNFLKGLAMRVRPT
jgi:uncharacterized protein YehS (DUF1456 family)